MFDGQASQNYVQHVGQNWANEPYIKGAYSDYFGSWAVRSRLAELLDDNVFFAGEAYAQEDNWVYAHTAARSGRQVAEMILTG